MLKAAHRPEGYRRRRTVLPRRRAASSGGGGVMTIRCSSLPPYPSSSARPRASCASSASSSRSCCSASPHTPCARPWVTCEGEGRGAGGRWVCSGARAAAHAQPYGRAWAQCGVKEANKAGSWPGGRNVSSARAAWARPCGGAPPPAPRPRTPPPAAPPPPAAAPTAGSAPRARGRTLAASAPPPPAPPPSPPGLSAPSSPRPLRGSARRLRSLPRAQQRDGVKGLRRRGDESAARSHSEGHVAVSRRERRRRAGGAPSGMEHSAAAASASRAAASASAARPAASASRARLMSAAGSIARRERDEPPEARASGVRLPGCPLAGRAALGVGIERTFRPVRAPLQRPRVRFPAALGAPRPGASSPPTPAPTPVAGIVGGRDDGRRLGPYAKEPHRSAAASAGGAPLSRWAHEMPSRRQPPSQKQQRGKHSRSHALCRRSLALFAVWRSRTSLRSSSSSPPPPPLRPSAASHRGQRQSKKYPSRSSRRRSAAGAHRSMYDIVTCLQSAARVKRAAG